MDCFLDDQEFGRLGFYEEEKRTTIMGSNVERKAKHDMENLEGRARNI